MTSVIPEQELPSPTPFLNSVCPGFSFLDHNVVYSIKDKVFPNGENQYLWLLSSSTSTNVAKLSPTYLNIARPPLSPTESSTYVSLPYHVTNLFKQVVNMKDKQLEGNMHIGANVNPLSQDPFKMVDLTPGCLSNILEINVNDEGMSFSPEHNLNGKESKNPFNKLTNNFNKLMKFTTIDHAPSTSYPSLAATNDFFKLMNYNSETYFQELKSTTTSKLLISSHVNILNVVAMDNSSNYKNSRDIVSKIPNIPYKDDLQVLEKGSAPESTASAAASIATNSNSIKEYKRTIEEPLLRVVFREGSIITSLKTFISKAGDSVVILGFGSGEIIIINLTHLTYQTFDNLDVEEANHGKVSVTAIDIIDYPEFDFLVFAGFSNGEVVILNAFGDDKSPKKTVSDGKKNEKYVKKIVDKDSIATYFKKFNLSHLEESTCPDPAYPDYLVGHFKISHKPITAITSTLPYNDDDSALNPTLIAIACDDGFVRFLDLAFTYNLERVEDLEQNKAHVFTDIISNYFNDGIRDVQFSPDFKFFCVVGKGDLIEIFKMTYFNVNGLIHKNSSGYGKQSHTSISAALSLNTVPSQGKRSRSGTLNSLTSTTQPTTMNSLFLSTNAPTSFPDFQRPPVERHNLIYSPILKDIKIVGRFKGHTNTVKGIRFIPDSLASESGVYGLMSYGYDAKILLWEFDYKATSKFKKQTHSALDEKLRQKTDDKKDKSKKKKSAGSRPPQILSQSARKSGKSLHARTRSVTKEELPILSISSPTFNALSTSLNSMANGGGASLNRILSNVSNEEISGEYHDDIVTNLYHSIYDLRFKRHYKALAKGTKKVVSNEKYGTIFHPIANDKEVPSFEIPLLSMDLSSLIHDGKVDGFHLDSENFWCFGKNGDIFRYFIESI